jgi:hypothetical protein
MAILPVITTKGFAARRGRSSREKELLIHDARHDRCPDFGTSRLAARSANTLLDLVPVGKVAAAVLHHQDWTPVACGARIPFGFIKFTRCAMPMMIVSVATCHANVGWRYF